MAIGKNVEVKFEDNSNTIKAESKTKNQKILYAIGLKWQEICTKIITRNGIVDTGRLRASLTFITSTKKGSPISSSPNSEGNDTLSGSAPENTLIVGSNVKYAAKQELSNKKGAFIKPSITDFKEDYKNIAETIMKE